MKVIDVEFPFAKNLITTSQVVLVLGFFDGVHIGHQRLIEAGRKEADKRNLPLMVMTFDKHPRVIYAGESDFLYLTTIPEKAQVMEQHGVDYLAVFKFNEKLAHLAPQRFVDEVILGLNAAVVVAGFDYTYGDKKVANMEKLPEFGRGRFDIVELPEQIFGGRKIGSTTIRNDLLAGNVTEANDLLGYPYSITGKVVPGKQRGRTIGFRTANLEFPDHKLIPAIGVYATKLLVHGKWHEAMTSIGYNVTFNDTKRIFIETNIFDFDEEIYGETITVAWYKFLRGEEKFAGLEELKEQLVRDEQETRAYFSNI